MQGVRMEFVLIVNNSWLRGERKNQYKPIFLGRGSSDMNGVHLILFSMMISAGWGLFPVYRLALDAKPDRVMLWLAENR